MVYSRENNTKKLRQIKIYINFKINLCFATILFPQHNMEDIFKFAQDTKADNLIFSSSSNIWQLKTAASSANLDEQQQQQLQTAFMIRPVQHHHQQQQQSEIDTIFNSETINNSTNFEFDYDLYYKESEVTVSGVISTTTTVASIVTTTTNSGAAAGTFSSTTALLANSHLNNYWALLALILVIGTAAGNILVCLAIAWERRLQNVTNYFLMSLAITDLMVAVLVMPLGILTLVKGKC